MNGICVSLHQTGPFRHSLGLEWDSDRSSDGIANSHFNAKLPDDLLDRRNN